MFWIEFRHPTDKLTTRYETDNLSDAVFVLRGVVINSDAQLIDFSGDLDGYLDHLLSGAKLFPATETAKVA
jgi:hypothetical protein